MLAGITVSADDGQILRRSVSSPPGETENPEPEGEHAYVSLMNFRVPTQRANGDVEPVEYYDIDGTLVMTLETAKPLINVFVFGPVTTFEDFSQSGFPGHGRRDAYAAVSLDDGETWKNTNLSNSGDKSSFNIAEPGIPDPGWPDTAIEEDPDGYVTTSASWLNRGRRGGYLSVAGTADRSAVVFVRNAVTHEELFSVRADRTGAFEDELRLGEAPCYVQAGDGEIWGNAVAVADAPEICVGQDEGPAPLITAYPGDVTNVFHSTAGNRVLVAWQSKFCGQGGFPGYALDDETKDELGTYLEIDNEVDLYLTDLFVVAGSQLSVDYREQEEFEGEYADVGEVPYNCLWSSRGILREDPENLGTTEVVWTQAERLTSGRRDVNRVEVKCVAGAGCSVTWQEDPEGLRPGEGEGAGTGWAGATTNSQTDVWYSFVEWEDMDIIDPDSLTNSADPLPLADNLLEAGRPQPYVPMMVPVRMTNNARCAAPVDPLAETYCNEDFAGAYGIENQCVGTIDIPLGPQGELQQVCVVDNNDSGTLDAGDLPNVANTASSRPRLNLQPRDSDNDGVTDDAWIIVTLEEDKGLGRFGFLNDEAWDGNVDNTATFCGDPDADLEDNCEEEIGKNQWYASFAMGTPQTSVLDESAAEDVDFSMLKNIVEQQNQYNAPEVNWITGTYYPPMSTLDMWDFGETLNYVIFNNEIARRASLMTQSFAKADASINGLMALTLFKEGVLRQGGPADIMARRVVLPDDFPGEAAANPYDFANMECAWYDGEGTVTEGAWIFGPDENPYYPKGLCGAPTLNLSGKTPHDCEVSGLGDGICPTAQDGDMTCEDDASFGQLCLSLTDPEDNQTLDKLISWYECPGWDGTDVSNGGNTGESTIPGACYSEDDSQLLQANLDDRSWYNPIDIAKAHRGFIDGDFVMMLYGWSPNWKLNKVGRDRYELYTRRSFDGGITWTTLPGSFTASNDVAYSGLGTTTCETWRDGTDSTTDSHICTLYEAGDPEQSRNLTQHKSMLITTLDPRYTPTIASMPDECPTWYQDDTGTCLSEWLLFTPITDDNLQGAVDPTDVREPSRYYIVYETGDNTTVAVGEAEPLNLDYGRAEAFGDYFTVWAETDTDTANLEECFPNDPHGTDTELYAEGTGFCNEFDTLEGFPQSISSEASLTSSAYGDFLYGVWGQFNLDTDTGEVIDSDSMFRRVWYIDDFCSETECWSLPGTGTGGE
jgi:hypothetical protein